MGYPIKDPIRVLEANGWRLDRVKGSHHIYKNDELRKTVPVPVHGNRGLGKGLYYKILEQCNVS